MKKNIFFLLFLLLNLNLILNSSCSTTEPPPPPDETKPTLTLALDDTSCTEAWLQLTTKDLSLPTELTLKQYNQTGDSLSQIFILNTQDSLLYIDSLLPNQNYFFQVSSIPHSGGQHQVSSIKQQVTTMDTTSNNFTWQTFTFGNIGSSILLDIAILNENDIWAVGEIKIRDSSLVGYADYNAIHWDGTNWELKKIMFYGVCGQTYTHPFPISSIFAFDENEIWVSLSGDQIAKIENGIQTEIVCLPWDFGIKKIWGTSSNDVYIVGYYGNIAHFDGANWIKIESGTTLTFEDIYGAYNVKTGKQEILAVCTQNYPLDKAIFKIDGDIATQISSNPIQWEVFSCWFVPDKHYYVVGSGIYEKGLLTENSWKNEPLDITHYGTTRIRGAGINDVFVIGAFGEILHYNGYSWKSFLTELGTFNGSYGSIDIKENLVAITGYEGAKAKITLARRN